MAVFAESAMIPKDLSAFNMGRGAYDTTGVKKPAKKLLVVFLHLVQGPWSFNVTAMKSNFFCITTYLIFLRSSLATSVFGIFDSVPNHVLVLSTITSIMD
ncbi:uncharacterized protein BO66DRAFT_436375 [Aspergillus aculeatinus CBS 121060]|uniref:Uncharacterized protein n=1 Tax=Aspergillus aculeatinus CBS 121060 TaxID=1448322 RepID=A0ACD1HFV0_9EURO|nr:hypothetical protein BO66DRAFT_436375 [Aspergillus aculeatinus CBS 121060]RAH72295.1 hypothetical protein BO66DRAFT_436375 [Aspergillus aculeatinus CBS 121060]